MGHASGGCLNLECRECVKESSFLISLCLQERIPIEEVFQQLKCTREGLSSDEGANRLQIFGPNKLEEKKVPSFIIHCLIHF